MASKKNISKNKNNEFKKALSNALVEKDVETAYKNILTVVYSNNESIISSPYGSDGVIESGLFLKLLLEVKYDEDLINTTKQRTVMVQALYYLKKFDDDDVEKPNIILIGDKNECFIIHGENLYPYLENEEIDWSYAPSDAPKKNASLIMKMVGDKNLQPYVFSINDTFDFNDVITSLELLAFHKQRVGVQINEKNIARVYDDFLRTVIGEKRMNEYDANKLVEIFMLSMIDPINTYLVPTKPNTLHLSSGDDISVDSYSFHAFFTQFDRNYTPSEIDKFTAIADRLIEDTKRRKQGSFWTPNIWVDKAHKIIADVVGQQWKDEYLVWDCSCGSMNLTRDYYFENLYCSTLLQEELSIGERYNPEAKKKFKFDFLNQDIEELPKELYDALQNKTPLIFFNNPPYAGAGTNLNGDNKTGLTSSFVADKMKNEGSGKASLELYAQFYWRMLDIIDYFDLKDVYIATFSKTLFLTGPSFKEFRKRFLSMMSYKKGILFNASNFDSVSDAWGIGFTVFQLNPHKYSQEVYPVDINEIHNDEIIVIDSKNLYNTDFETPASEWIREKMNGIKTTRDCVNLRSPLNPDKTPKCRGSLCDNSLGYFMNNSNNVDMGMRYVNIQSAPSSRGNGINIIRENIYDVVSLFSARTLIKSTWINERDEYLKPNLDDSLYSEWQLDSIIYSIFSNQSFQSSLRNINIDGKTYNIENHFFYMSNNDIKTLANENNYHELFYDAKNSEDRLIYKIIKENINSMSIEAQSVLTKAQEITALLIKEGYRRTCALSHPEYQLDSWDASWYQMKLIIKEYNLPYLNDFNILFNNLKERMAPMVYVLGFLKK